MSNRAQALEIAADYLARRKSSAVDPNAVVTNAKVFEQYLDDVGASKTAKETRLNCLAYAISVYGASASTPESVIEIAGKMEDFLADESKPEARVAGEPEPR